MDCISSILFSYSSVPMTRLWRGPCGDLIKGEACDERWLSPFMQFQDGFMVIYRASFILPRALHQTCCRTLGNLKGWCLVTGSISTGTRGIHQDLVPGLRAEGKKAESRRNKGDGRLPCCLISSYPLKRVCANKGLEPLYFGFK